MALTFAIKCPYCLLDNTAFSVITEAEPKYARNSGRNWIEVFATCNACGRGVVTSVKFNTTPRARLLDMKDGLLESTSDFTVGQWLPRPPRPDVPEHLPDVVLPLFERAELLRLSDKKLRPSAGNAYRQALEAALKAVDPALGGTLYSRIEKLTARGDLTKSMCEFAHQIRNLGNEASHDTQFVAYDEIEALALFTRMLLMYMFTLPGMLPKAVAGP